MIKNPAGTPRTTRLNARLFLVFAISITIFVIAGCKASDPKEMLISGFIVTPNVGSSDDVFVVKASDLVYVPSIDVWLQKTDDATRIDPVKTDLSGRFRFIPREKGEFRLCWEAAAFLPACADEHLYLGQFLIDPNRKAGTTVVFGSVRMGDGSLPRTLEPMANVNAFATVAAPGNALIPSAFVNNYGNYVMPLVPVKSTVTLAARIENGSQSLAAVIGSSLFERVDFQFSNEPPVMHGIVGNAPGNRHWTASPGDVVEFEARVSDPNGDTLQYHWIFPDGSTAITVDSTATYKLPELDGKYEFTVMAYDKKGGYAKETISISTRGVRFSGQVAATDSPLVAGAEVELNGKQTITDADGRFDMFVEEQGRYVLNIRKHGYQTVSKIYDNSLLGGNWTLTRASVDNVDPALVIDVVNEREPGDCPGALSGRRGRYQTGQGEKGGSDQREPGRSGQRDCGPGIRVRIPAGGLVDQDGNLPTGNVNIALVTIDTEAPDGMPGDYTARTSGGTTVVMETFGAGFVDIFAAGKTYNLAPGVEAEITIPIVQPVFATGATIPFSIPLLSFDESLGIWQEVGKAQRDGDTYKGFVSHFSAINMDLLKQNQACIRLETVAMAASFELEVTILPSGGGAPTTKTATIDNGAQRFHVVYNLPTSGTIEFRSFEDGTPIDLLVEDPPGSGTFIEGQVITVEDPAPQSPTNPNLPEFPYAACSVSVEFIPFRLPEDTIDQFLAGLFSFRAVNLTELEKSLASEAPYADATAAYYETIDPNDLRETLDEFKNENGFPAGEVSAFYGNSADLGFGRAMHCRRESVSGLAGFDVACYVTNYGNRFTDYVDDFIAAIGNIDPIATVGMEYSRVEVEGSTDFQSDTRIVKFYVFGGNENRAADADLDGFGRRPVPQLCMVCHGGRYPAGLDTSTLGAPAWVTNDFESANLGSNFIPFDIPGFTLPTVSGTDYKVEQQAEFKQLNTEIVAETDPSAAILEVVEEMYGGPGYPLSDQVEEFVVDGWNSSSGTVSEQDVYRDVVGPSCRTCHASQPSSIAWDDADQWFPGFVGSLVCSQHVMPHAIVTHNRFWLSLGPHQPLTLNQYLDSLSSGSADDCAP